MGKVYFVGAGPFGEALLTREGFRILEQADCVLYDHLLDDSILSTVKGECIYVGKQANHHHMPQDEINALLVEKAHQYECIVRLKGGDSLVFGRGGEEGQVLKNNAIPFAFIPGISSCIAVAELAGIPLTHRGVASGFQVISAHLQNHKLDIEEAQLSNPSITLVFMMGLARVDLICKKLRLAKRSEDTPIAIISQGASPQQKVLTATLASVMDEMKKNVMVSPAVIVVGNVVKLRDVLQHDTQVPLLNKHIMVRKIGTAISPLTHLLKSAGAHVKECQIGDIKFLDIDEEIARIRQYKTILFTSKYGVQGMFKALYKQGLDARFFHDKVIVALGKKVAKQLKEYAVIADKIMEGTHLDIQSDEEVISSTCIHIKAKHSMLDAYPMHAVSVYENVICPQSHMDEDFDAICFTSVSSVERYTKQFNKEICISIGESTSKALREKQAKHIIQATYPSYESMVETYIQEVGPCIEVED